MTSVAFVPCAPLLIPQIAAGSSAELDELRAACDDAVARVLEYATRCVVLAPGDTSRLISSPVEGNFRGFGVDLVVHHGTEEGAPIGWQASLGVWLANRAARGGELMVVEVESPMTGVAVLQPLIDNTTAVVCVGDGSAGLGVKSPGYVIDGAEKFDDAVGRAIAEGSPSALFDLDLSEGLRVMAAGTPVWATLGAVASAPALAQLTLRTAPHGVTYFVGSWQHV